MAEAIVTSDADVSKIDRAISKGLWLPSQAVSRITSQAAEKRGLSPLVLKPRIGRNGELFIMQKFRTHDDNDVPLDDTCEMLDETGASELANAANIANGEMLWLSWRPLDPVDHERFLESLSPRLRTRWIRDVLPNPPGVASSYSALAHASNGSDYQQFEQKAEMDIQDQADGRLRVGLNIVNVVAVHGVQSRVKARLGRRRAASEPHQR